MGRLEEYYSNIENNQVLLECLIQRKNDIHNALTRGEDSEVRELHYDALWKECRKRDLIGDDPFPDIPIEDLLDN